MKVLVIGADPVGLTVALEFPHHGIKSAWEIYSQQQVLTARVFAPQQVEPTRSPELALHEPDPQSFLQPGWLIICGLPKEHG